jgi:hypothetical protein
MATYGECRTAEIDATPARCCEVLTDYERLPEWQGAVRAARVLERDEQGRGSVVDAVGVHQDSPRRSAPARVAAVEPERPVRAHVDRALLRRPKVNPLWRDVRHWPGQCRAPVEDPNEAKTPATAELSLGLYG